MHVLYSQLSHEKTGLGDAKDQPPGHAASTWKELELRPTLSGSKALALLDLTQLSFDEVHLQACWMEAVGIILFHLCFIYVVP